LALFAALFIWPIINATISFYLTGSISLPKHGAEIKIGGFGDFLSAICTVDNLIQGTPFARASLFLMLITNLILLIPVSMMYQRIRKKVL